MIGGQSKRPVARRHREVRELPGLRLPGSVAGRRDRPRGCWIASSRVDVAHYFIEESASRPRSSAAGARTPWPLNSARCSGHPCGGAAGTVRTAGRAPDAAARRGAQRRDQALDPRAALNAEWALSAQLEVLARSSTTWRTSTCGNARRTSSRSSSGCCARARAARRAGSGGARLRGRRPAGAGRQRHRARRHAAVQAQRVHRFHHDVGGKTSHTAIVARSLDIPAVVGRARRAD